MRLNKIRIGAVAVGAVLALGMSACNGGGETEGAAADTLTIGFMGDLTGENSGLVIPPRNGAQMAIDEYNATNPPVKITLKTYDSQGRPEQANSLAKQAVQQDDIVGLIGPAFSGETAQVGPILEEAGVPSVSPSATNAKLGQNGWQFWHRMVGNDDVQGQGVGTFITNGLQAKRVFLIDDSSEYGRPLAQTVQRTVEAAGAQTETDSIDPNAADYGSTVNSARAFNPDAIFFGGYYSEAGRLVKQLREGGVEARFLAGDGSLDPGLAKGAGGTTADGSVIACPCLIDPTGKASPQSKTFAEKYKAKFNTDPAIYAAEGYDAATAFVEAVKAGATTPAEINEAIAQVNIPGVSKQIQFSSNGEPTAANVFVYEVQGSTLPLIGPAAEATLG